MIAGGVTQAAVRARYVGNLGLRRLEHIVEVVERERIAVVGVGDRGKARNAQVVAQQVETRDHRPTAITLCRDPVERRAELLVLGAQHPEGLSEVAENGNDPPAPRGDGRRRWRLRAQPGKAR